MRLLGAIFRSLLGLARGESASPPARRLELVPDPPLPNGWPEGYGYAQVPGVDSPRFVVVVRGKRTSAPRWPDLEGARRDAWERRWREDAERVDAESWPEGGA